LVTGKQVEQRPGGAVAFVAAGLPDGGQIQSGGEWDRVVEGSDG
jgi:hypothetical protein